MNGGTGHAVKRVNGSGNGSNHFTGNAGFHMRNSLSGGSDRSRRMSSCSRLFLRLLPFVGNVEDGRSIALDDGCENNQNQENNNQTRYQDG